MSLHITLIAHESKAEEMVDFGIAYEHELQNHQLYVTGSIARRIKENTNLMITPYMSGPMSGTKSWR